MGGTHENGPLTVVMQYSLQPILPKDDHAG